MVVLFWYLVTVSAVTVCVTVYDKLAAQNGRWRIPEKTLLTLGILGGAFAELATMKIIRHKTKHPRFMIGLPVMILLHAAIIWLMLNQGIL